MSTYANANIVRNSIFLKVDQGRPHTIRLLDLEPVEQWQHKINDKLVICKGDLCDHCQEGHSKNQRFVTNVYTYTDRRVMLWSYGPTVAEAIKALALSLIKDEEDILDHDLEVSVTGAGLQKKTSIQLRLKSQTLPSTIKRIEIKDANGIPF